MARIIAKIYRKITLFSAPQTVVWLFVSLSFIFILRTFLDKRFCDWCPALGQHLLKWGNTTIHATTKSGISWWYHDFKTFSTLLALCEGNSSVTHSQRWLSNTDLWCFRCCKSEQAVEQTVVLLKGLRPVLEGFVVTMHKGACETGSQIPRALARGIWRTVRTSPSALWQQTPTDRS